MSSQLTSNAKALRLFFTDDVYLVKSEMQNTFVEPVKLSSSAPQPPVVVKLVDEKIAVKSAVLPNLVEEPKPLLQKAITFKFLGKNEKQILILVNDKQNEVSSEQGRELLRKLVNAIALTAKDFALVNYANYEAAKFNDLHQFFGSKMVLAFGVFPNQLGLNEQPLNQFVAHNDSKLIFTKNLHDLDTDPTSKKLLWASLQQIK